MSRWHEDCLGRCEDCLAASKRRPVEDTYQRFMTIGPVRYGMRLGAVSPPPPGAGPRYRSQCCWPTTPCGDEAAASTVSRIPLLAATPINSSDIISCANRSRMGEDSASDRPLTAVRDHVLYGKCVLNAQLKRCALVRPQVYTRLQDQHQHHQHQANGGKEDNSTLDRLPRFRFGGNRIANNEQRYRELADRQKRGVVPVPVPPPRTRHLARVATPQSAPPPECDEFTSRVAPSRSVSFSQVDFCSDDNKYVRRLTPANPETESGDSPTREISTLPRSKNILRTSGPSDKPRQHFKVNSELFQSVTEEQNEQTPIPTVEVTETVDKQCRNQDCSNQDRKRDKSRRRKGIYISQWPNTYQSSESVIPQFVQDGDFQCASRTKELLQDSIEKISKLQVQEDSKDFPLWSSPQEEPLSPEDNNTAPEWPAVPVLPKPRNQSRSPEEKDTFKVNRGVVLFRSELSLSEGETELAEPKPDQISLIPSDVSDCESRISNTAEQTSPSIPRHYPKRPLRGPYGQMLEAEMKKPDSRKNLNNELKFLEDLSSFASTSMNNLSKCGNSGKHRSSCNSSMDSTVSKDNKSGTAYLSSPKQVTKRKVSADNLVVANENDKKLVVSHQRTTSSPSKLDGFANNEVSCELLEQLLRGSSEQYAADSNQQQKNDTRTHVVVELYDNERTYVDSLEILVTQYLEPLKLPENSNLLDSNLVDEIFYQIPFLLKHHQFFLDQLKERIETWDIKQKIGDVFLEMFSNQTLIDIYTIYVNNWKRAREILKNAQQSKPAFGKFLETTARLHAGKLALDSLLIKPIQKFPKYELLLQRLIKHTDEDHPDHGLLLDAQRQVHDQLLKINCTEKEALELEQLREIESLIDGLMDLAVPDRQYLRHDSVAMSHGGNPKKERALFLFSDLLLVTGIKRRSGTIRRPVTGQAGSFTSSLEANKYKLMMRIPLEDIEIIRSKDEHLRQIMLEVDNLNDDIHILHQISELSYSLHSNRNQLDDMVKDMIAALTKQLTEQQNSDSQLLCCLDLTVFTTNGLETVSILFSKATKRSSWEESLIDAKQKLALSGESRPCPELLATVPIRKTRAGLQFTCASPALSEVGKDVWVCNSDGYVGQVCVLSLQPEPTVISCNGVCNARILCIAAVPKARSSPASCAKGFKAHSRAGSKDMKKMQFDSSSSDEEFFTYNEEPSKVNLEDGASADLDDDCKDDKNQPTMWLGTEDGSIHVYNSGDNVRIKKTKIKIQLGTPILSIIYLDNRVYASLANGDILSYTRDSVGNWNINFPIISLVGSLNMPVSKMVPSGDKLWCACGNNVKICHLKNLAIENSFAVHNDNTKVINCIVLSGSNGIWISLLNSAVIKCYNANSFELLCEVNVAPATTKMLTSCDDIIRQHKAACLRVTAMVSCKDLLWIGTSAGVLLTMPVPHVSPSTMKLVSIPTITGVPHGHTGHVRFLTEVELPSPSGSGTTKRSNYKLKQEPRSSNKFLVISGGDGYEDFRQSNVSEVAGREDSTNHLLLWNI